jgi:NAD(P)-dependent dehydrogenase (short-subunit alcohol dehydrogenase family)
MPATSVPSHSLPASNTGHAPLALIAGAGETGVAIARSLQAAGMRVLLTDRSILTLSHAARTLPQPVSCLPADLSRNAEVEYLAEEMAELGGCDLLIHTPPAPRPDLTGLPQDPLSLQDADWQEPWESTFMSAMRTARAMVPQMLRKGWGRVIFVSPPEPPGATARPTEAAARAALAHFTHAVGALYADRGITFAALDGADTTAANCHHALCAHVLRHCTAETAKGPADTRADGGTRARVAKNPTPRVEPSALRRVD